MGNWICQDDIEGVEIKTQFRTKQPIEGIPLVAKQLTFSEVVPFTTRWFRYNVPLSKSSDNLLEIEESRKPTKREPILVTLSYMKSYIPSERDIGNSLIFQAKALVPTQSPEIPESIMTFKETLPYPKSPSRLHDERNTRITVFGNWKYYISCASVNLTGFIFPRNMKTCFPEEHIQDINKIYPIIDPQMQKKLYNFIYRKRIILQDIRSRECDIFCLNHIHPDEFLFLENIFKNGMEENKKKKNKKGSKKNNYEKIEYGYMRSQYSVRSNIFFPDRTYLDHETRKKRLYSAIFFNDKKFKCCSKTEIRPSQFFLPPKKSKNQKPPSTTEKEKWNDDFFSKFSPSQIEKQRKLLNSKVIQVLKLEFKSDVKADDVIYEMDSDDSDTDSDESTASSSSSSSTVSGRERKKRKKKFIKYLAGVKDSKKNKKTYFYIVNFFFFETEDPKIIQWQFLLIKDWMDKKIKKDSSIANRRGRRQPRYSKNNKSRKRRRRRRKKNYSNKKEEEEEEEEMRTSSSSSCSSSSSSSEEDQEEETEGEGEDTEKEKNNKNEKDNNNNSQRTTKRKNIRRITLLFGCGNSEVFSSPNLETFFDEIEFKNPRKEFKFENNNNNNNNNNNENNNKRWYHMFKFKNLNRFKNDIKYSDFYNLRKNKNIFQKFKDEDEVDIITKYSRNLEFDRDENEEIKNSIIDTFILYSSSKDNQIEIEKKEKEEEQEQENRNNKNKKNNKNNDFNNTNSDIIGIRSIRHIKEVSSLEPILNFTKNQYFPNEFYCTESPTFQCQFVMN